MTRIQKTLMTAEWNRDRCEREYTKAVAAGDEIKAALLNHEWVAWCQVIGECEDAICDEA